MQGGYIFDQCLGYAQSATTDFNSAALVSSMTFSSLAASGAAGPSAAGIPAGTKMLLIQPEAQAIRLRADGTAPTATVGYPIAALQEFRFSGNFPALQIIGQANGAKVNVWAFG